MATKVMAVNRGEPGYHHRPLENVTTPFRQALWGKMCCGGMGHHAEELGDNLQDQAGKELADNF